MEAECQERRFYAVLATAPGNVANAERGVIGWMVLGCGCCLKSPILIIPLNLTLQTMARRSA